MKNLEDIQWKVKVCMRKKRLDRYKEIEFYKNQKHELNKSDKSVSEGSSIYSPKNIMGI